MGGGDEPEGTHQRDTHSTRGAGQGRRERGKEEGGRIFVKSPGNLWTAKGPEEGTKEIRIGAAAATTKVIF